MRQIQICLGLAASVFLFSPGLAEAGPILVEFALHAETGSQFGASAPADFTGSFTVDSSFLAQVDGSYGGSAIAGFSIQIGDQLFDQATAFAPEIQRILLVDHQIAGLAMNWFQTPDGFRGPFLQMAGDGTWVSGLTVFQGGGPMLRGGPGSQSFSIVPEPSTLPLATLGGISCLGWWRLRRGRLVLAPRGLSAALPRAASLESRRAGR